MFTRLKSRDRDRDVISSRPRRDETFQKNVSRPPRDRDVQDRDYIPGIWHHYLREMERLSFLHHCIIYPRACASRKAHGPSLNYAIQPTPDGRGIQFTRDTQDPVAAAGPIIHPECDHTPPDLRSGPEFFRVLTNRTQQIAYGGQLSVARPHCCSEFCKTL